jgi:hypothetical protein
MIMLLAFTLASVLTGSIAPGAPSDPRGSTIYFVVSKCAEDGPEIPRVELGPPNTRLSPISSVWSDLPNNLVKGEIKVEPAGWQIASVRTTHCFSGKVPVAVLPGHSRHIGLVLSRLPGIVDLPTVMLAGELPLPGLSVVVDRSWSYDPQVDDGAYYIPLRRQPYVLEVRSNMFAQIGVDLSAASPGSLVRRDIRLAELRQTALP